jgi:hypothetical protein
MPLVIKVAAVAAPRGKLPSTVRSGNSNTRQEHAQGDQGIDKADLNSTDDGNQGHAGRSAVSASISISVIGPCFRIGSYDRA